MKILVVDDRLSVDFTKIILANELGGDLSLAYKFSDPDGERSGKSGWSFGICQFDINNNPNAIVALREMGFTTDEVARLRAQDVPIEPMNAKLKANAETVNKWDRQQMRECLTLPFQYCTELGVDFTEEESFLAVADYHNQFYMSRGGKMYSWLRTRSCSVSPEMVRDFKLSLPWGVKRPADVVRRYENIARVMRAGSFLVSCHTPTK